MEHLIPMCVMCAKHEIGTFDGATDATCSAACEAALIKQVQEINRKLGLDPNFELRFKERELEGK